MNNPFVWLVKQYSKQVSITEWPAFAGRSFFFQWKELYSFQITSINKYPLSEDVKINPSKLGSCFSFMRGEKSANSKLFIPIAIGIATKQKWKRTFKPACRQAVGFILSSSLIFKLAFPLKIVQATI